MIKGWKPITELPQEDDWLVVRNIYGDYEIAQYYNPDPGPYSTCYPSFSIQATEPKFKEEDIIEWLLIQEHKEAPINIEWVHVMKP